MLNIVSHGFDSSGNRIKYTKSIKANSRREADKELVNFVYEIENGIVLQNSSMTFKEFTDLWAKNLFDLKVLSETFETMSFVIEYSLAALVVAIILGLITGWLLDIYTKFINFIRRKKNMSDIAISHMVFDDIFNSPEYEFIEDRKSVV